MLSTCCWLRSANAPEILDGARRDRLLTSAEPTYLTQGYLPHVRIRRRARARVCVCACICADTAVVCSEQVLHLLPLLASSAVGEIRRCFRKGTFCLMDFLIHAFLLL